MTFSRPTRSLSQPVKEVHPRREVEDRVISKGCSLTPSARLLAIAIGKHLREVGGRWIAYPSVWRLARLTGIGDRTVRAKLKELSEMQEPIYILRRKDQSAPRRRSYTFEFVRNPSALADARAQWPNSVKPAAPVDGSACAPSSASASGAVNGGTAMSRGGEEDGSKPAASAHSAGAGLSPISGSWAAVARRRPPAPPIPLPQPVVVPRQPHINHSSAVSADEEVNTAPETRPQPPTPAEIPVSSQTVRDLHTVQGEHRVNTCTASESELQMLARFGERPRELRQQTLTAALSSMRTVTGVIAMLDLLGGSSPASDSQGPILDRLLGEHYAPEPSGEVSDIELAVARIMAAEIAAPRNKRQRKRKKLQVRAAGSAS